MSADIARDDQVAAATAELHELLVRADDDGSPQLHAPGIVSAPVVARVWSAAGAGALRRCAHLASPAPATVLAACPEAALCQSCLCAALYARPAVGCDGCGRQLVADDAWQLLIALGPLAVHLALCGACCALERGTSP